MAEYIERDKLYKHFEKSVTIHEATINGSTYPVYLTDHVLHEIRNAPAADVVEVVRCKDCKYWGGVVFGYRCRKLSGMNTQIQTSENDFCSYGERKSDNGDAESS